MCKNDFFLSYSRDSYLEVTESMISYLETKGFNIWVDRYDVPFGVDVYDNIKKVITDAKEWNGAIILFDPTYFSKNWCILELDELILNNISILPILWKIKKEDFPESYRNILKTNYAKTIYSIDDLPEIINAITLFYVKTPKYLPKLNGQSIDILKDMMYQVCISTDFFNKLILTSILIEFFITKSKHDTSALHWLSISKAILVDILSNYFETKLMSTYNIKFIDAIKDTIIKKYSFLHEYNR
ncbi:toll/interleukin-1 receptor domain-containing protein [Pseudolactococcus piscium]|uniref:toll/interleukin-1 receptor domain-containing protein n=1 Tax=Pseudolactococcus piscium TaxID=1364 RepID=UPI000BDE9F5B|nr:toll/interleukin-1 receptor domain-containing protein [Lactococcus piscium]